MASLLQPAGGRRQEIVEIGAGVIAERGYRAATLQEISERTGLLKGSLYHYISSKEDLADDLVDGAIEEMDAQIFNLLTDPALAPGARVREFIRRQVALARSPMSRVGMVARSHRELPDGPRARWRAMTEQLVAHLEVLIGQGIETGAFAPIRHPRMAAHALAAAAEPGQARMYSGLPAGPIDDGIALLILHGLAAPERARGLEFLPPRLRPGWSDQTESFESRILDAAAGAILDRGYASVTMRDIAAAAGVPKTTIFRILGSKNALFDRIVSDLYRRADAWTAPAFELQAPAPVRLIEFFSLHVQFCVRHRAMIPVTQDHLEQIPGADRRLRMERRFGYHNALAEIIRQGQREGSLRDDIDPDLARWTLMIMAASIPEWFSGAEAIDRSAVEFSDTLSRIALDGLSASG